MLESYLWFRFSCEFKLIIVSQNLKYKISAAIPNCITPPTCTKGKETITLIRTTKKYASEENFFIRDSNGFTKYQQPTISNDQEYTWSISLCKGDYTLYLTDGNNNGWSSGSNIVIKKGSTTIGTFRCSNSQSTVSFTV